MKISDFERGFRTGWGASGEGYNGEYPDGGKDWEGSKGQEALENYLRFHPESEPEYEYGVLYAPGYWEFEGETLDTVRRRAAFIRERGGYPNAKPIRRVAPGEFEGVDPE